MKIAVILVVAFWATAGCTMTNKATLSRAAAVQLQRLAPFRRSTLDKNILRKSNEFLGQQLRIPIDFNELISIFNNTGFNKRISSMTLSPEKIDVLNRYADKLMQDERVQLYVQERIKRDGYGEEYGSKGNDGSGTFISGLAGQLVGSVVGLSSTGSKGSSSFSGHKSPAIYGPPVYQSYGKDSFNIWDFKRAILNTLIQAVKAISGGILALKGQLIKGGGFLVSTKGRIISSAGETISGLGKSLASSAIVQPPPQYPAYGYGGYTYETPQIVESHDQHYDGPPPSPDRYHSSFGAASDNQLTDVTFTEDNIQPGLLIAKPTGFIETYMEDLQKEQFQVDQLKMNQCNTKFEETEELDARNPSYSVKNVSEIHSIEQKPHFSVNERQLEHYNHESHKLYPPLENGPSYKRINHQQTLNHYTPAVKYPTTVIKNTHKIPMKYKIPSVDFHHNNYLLSRLHIDPHQTPNIRIEISNQEISGFESGGYSQYITHQPGLHVVAMQGPLKIPILRPFISGYRKNLDFPTSPINTITGFGKNRKYEPNFEIHQSIGYKLQHSPDAIYAYAYYPSYLHYHYRRSKPMG